jgi:single-stranded DNA-binding protein
VAFNRLGDSIADTLSKGDHVLVDGQLVSSKYERENGKSKKAKAAQFAIFWCVRANSVRRLSRAEAEAPAQTAAPEPASDDAPFLNGMNRRPSDFGRRDFLFVLISSQFENSFAALYPKRGRFTPSADAAASRSSHRYRPRDRPVLSPSGPRARPRSLRKYLCAA